MSSLPPRRARPGLGRGRAAARVRREHASPCVARTPRRQPGLFKARRHPGTSPTRALAARTPCAAAAETLAAAAPVSVAVAALSPP
jgi:hypothetical protein